MYRPRFNPFHVASRRIPSGNPSERSSVTPASSQSQHVREYSTNSIFATGDSVEQEVNEQAAGEERFIKARKDALEDKLKLIRERIPQNERDHFNQWVGAFEKEVETPENPDWNYFYPANFKKISGTIENLWKPSQAPYFPHFYTINVSELVQNMHLEQPIVEYRKRVLLEDLTKFVDRAHRIHNADAGMVKNWARSLIRTIETMYDQHYYNYRDQHNWRRISAVTSYIAYYDKNHPPPYACIVEGDHIVSVLEIENLIEQMKLRAPAH